MSQLYTLYNSLIVDGNQFGCCCSSSSSSSSSSPSTYTYKLQDCALLVEYKLTNVTNILNVGTTYYIFTQTFAGCVTVISGDPEGLTEIPGPLYFYLPYPNCEDCILDSTS